MLSDPRKDRFREWYIRTNLPTQVQLSESYFKNIFKFKASAESL